MATVAELLRQKGHAVETIAPNDTVFEAIKRMADLDIGALVVIEDGKVVGMITERDYARKVFLRGKASPTTPVHEAMERDLLAVRLEDTTRDCMAIMTGERRRNCSGIGSTSTWASMSATRCFGRVTVTTTVICGSRTASSS